MHLPRAHRLLISALLIGGVFSLTAAAQSDRTDDVRRVQRSTEIFNTIFNGPGNKIPRNLMRNGECLVIIPGYKNLAFAVGGSYGKGIATCRVNPQAKTSALPGETKPTPVMPAGWSAPTFVALGGASFGFQIGVESADVIMVFQSRQGLESVLNNKIRLGAAAAAAAGPVGRRMEAATDAAMRSQVLAYAQSRGVFAGVNLNGAVLQPDESGNRAMYPHQYWQDVLEGNIRPDASGQTLVTALNTSPITSPTARQAPPSAAGQPAGLAAGLAPGPGPTPPLPYDVGIAWEHITGDIGLNGWNARAGWRPLRVKVPEFSVVTNFGRDTGSSSAGTTSVDRAQWTVLFGPEFDLPHRVFDPYGHVLFGWANQHDTTTTLGASTSQTSNTFAWDLGGGLKLNFTRWVDVRVLQLDLLHTNFANGGGSHARISFGGSFHF